MNTKTLKLLTLAAALAMSSFAIAAPTRVALTPAAVTNEAKHGEPAGLVDEQADIGAVDNAAPSGAPDKTWSYPSQFNKTDFPASAYIDLGEERHVTAVWFYDLNAKGDVVISSG